MVEFAFLSPKTGFDIAQTFPKSKLSKYHAEVLVVTAEMFDLVVAAITGDALT
jgi:hypothetical protein